MSQCRYEHRRVTAHNDASVQPGFAYLQYAFKNAVDTLQQLVHKPLIGDGNRDLHTAADGCGLRAAVAARATHRRADGPSVGRNLWLLTSAGACN